MFVFNSLAEYILKKCHFWGQNGEIMYRKYAFSVQISFNKQCRVMLNSRYRVTPNGPYMTPYDRILWFNSSPNSGCTPTRPDKSLTVVLLLLLYINVPFLKCLYICNLHTCTYCSCLDLVFRCRDVAPIFRCRDTLFLAEIYCKKSWKNS